MRAYACIHCTYTTLIILKIDKNVSSYKKKRFIIHQLIKLCRDTCMKHIV